LISLLAEGKKPAELAVQFNKAAGTIANFQTRNKGEINEQRRKRTVQFEDLFIVRKQARLDDYQDLRNIAMGQIRALLASCFVIDGQTGQPEFAADLVDHRKLKVYSDMVFKADKLAAEETGQLPQRVDGLDQQWTAKVLGVNGKGGVDYPVLTQAAREWDAGAPQRAAERARKEAVREEWLDDSLIRSLVRDGTSRGLAADIVQRERDRKNGFSPEEVRQRSMERSEAADYAEAVANLELICEETVTMDEERNPLRLDAVGLEEARSYLKERGFPGDEAAHVRIDCFFDSWEYPDDVAGTTTESSARAATSSLPVAPEPEVVKGETDPRPVTATRKHGARQLLGLNAFGAATARCSVSPAIW
jgi:hypothetical protein